MAEMNWLEKPVVNSRFWNFIYKKLLYNIFLNFVGDKLNGNLLEIGCGIGKTTSWLNKKYPKVKIIAVDYDDGQIEIAKKNQKMKNIKFVQGDATKLKLKNSYFDYVIETNVFHHISNYTEAIREVKRILKKNGSFYLMDASKYFLWPLSLFFGESSFTKNEFIKSLEDNGLRVEKSSRYFFFFIAAKKVQS